MRILHTSDWHLGQNFYSKSREAEHQAFLDWLLETAQTHQFLAKQSVLEKQLQIENHTNGKSKEE